MSDNKKPRLNQSSSAVRLGKNGPLLKANSGSVDAKNNTDAARSIIRGADPVDPEDAVSKQWAVANIGSSRVPYSTIELANPEMILNGNFDTDISNWATAGIGSFSFSNGRILSNTGTGFIAARQIVSGFVPGQRYVITGTFSKSAAFVSQFATIRIWNSAVTVIIANEGSDTALTQTIKYTFTATEATHVVDLTLDRASSASISWSAISCTKIIELPTPVAGTCLDYSHISAQRINTFKRIGPALGHKISAYGNVVEYPGFIEFKHTNTSAFFIAVNSTTWCLVSDFTFDRIRNVETPYAIFGRNTWVSKGANPVARHAFNGESVNGFGYHQCGLISSGVVTGENSRYDDILEAFTSKAVNPFPREETASFALNGYSHALAGYDYAPNRSSAHNRYIDAANAWETRQAVTSARQGPSAESLNGYGYITKGLTTVTIANHEQYRESSNTWATKASHPVAGYISSSVTLFGYIYNFYGLTNVEVNTNYQYDDFREAWLIKAPGPNTVYGVPHFALNNYVHGVGGRQGSSYFDVNAIYNPFTNKWDTRQATGVPAFHRGGFSLNGYGFVTAGFNGTTTLTSTQQYN